MSNTTSHAAADLLRVVVLEPDGTATRQEWPHDQTLACLEEALAGLFGHPPAEILLAAPQ